MTRSLQAAEKLNALKGHGFSRAECAPERRTALASEGMQLAENEIPQGLKPIIFSGFFGTTEVVPFQNRAKP